MINENTFTDSLYDKLPSVYREEDYKIGKPLYRYLQASNEGGFSLVIRDSNGFLYLVDPETCPEAIFPYLYGSFGLTYYEDIPIKYHRRFLSNIGALMKRRGTNAAVKYLVRVLTGLEVELSYERRYDEEGKCTGRFLTIQLLIDSIEDTENVQVSIEVIKKFIKTQVPFYITPEIIFISRDNVISVSRNSDIAITSMVHSTITPKIKEES